MKKIIIFIVIVLIVVGVEYIIQRNKQIAGGEQEIQLLLAQKYDKPIADVSVKATKQNADYMVGTVSFSAPGLPEPEEGGMFLAARQNNAWILVYDGNGSVDCDYIKTNYQFPADMLVGFCD